MIVVCAGCNSCATIFKIWPLEKGIISKRKERSEIAEQYPKFPTFTRFKIIIGYLCVE